MCMFIVMFNIFHNLEIMVIRSHICMGCDDIIKKSEILVPLTFPTNISLKWCLGLEIKKAHKLTFGILLKIGERVEKDSGINIITAFSAIINICLLRSLSRFHASLVKMLVNMVKMWFCWS